MLLFPLTRPRTGECCNVLASSSLLWCPQHCLTWQVVVGVAVKCYSSSSAALPQPNVVLLTCYKCAALGANVDSQAQCCRFHYDKTMAGACLACVRRPNGYFQVLKLIGNRPLAIIILILICSPRGTERDFASIFFNCSYQVA